MAGVQPPPLPALKAAAIATGNDVFISYSRRDQAFVRRLEAEFRRANRDPWVDWNDIQKGEEWWKAIQRGIEAASTFVFVLSPDAAASRVCRDEIEYAAHCHKRFLPIVYREGFQPEQLHPAISSHNWLFFRETDDFDAAFAELQQAIDTDLDYVRAHARLLVRAIEWRDRDRNPSYLLRSAYLAEAEQWLVQSMGKQPLPTELHSQYLSASREAESSRIQARKRAERIVILCTVGANMLLAAIGCYWFYRVRMNDTMERVESHLLNSVRVEQIGINGDRFAQLAAIAVLQGDAVTRSPLYQEHQDWLCRVHQVFPNAILRTYIAGARADQIRWVGDVARDFPARCPSQLSNVQATQVLEPYLSRHFEREVIEQAIEISPVTDIYEDNLGRWISASGAIRNGAGRVVGGVKVDFRAAYVEEERRKVLPSLLGSYLAIFLWLFVLSWIILRATRATDR